MLTSFFNKSKPINFLIVGIFMSLYYILENFLLSTTPLTTSYFFEKLGYLLVYLLLMILVNFIVKRNRVTKRNSFAIVLFALFSVSFSAVLKTEEVLISSFFILLALRRIISLRSGITIKKKIFDASLWICIAALFFEWSLLFFVVVFVAILFHAANDYRNWMVPILAMLCVFVLFTCFHLLVWESFFNVFYFFPLPDLNFSKYGEMSILFPLSLMLSFSLWTVADYLMLIKKTSNTLKSSFVLILVIWLVSIFIVVFSSTKNGSELLFFIIPTAIIGANYLQYEKDKIFKEVLLVLLMVSIFVWPFLI